MTASGYHLIATASLVIVAFAGCIGGDASTAADGSPEIPEAAEPAEFGETTGAVQGFVLDDEQAPVPGATVALAQKDPPVLLETITDLEGKFTLSQVAPGKYALFVQKLGYNSASKAVEVQVGQAVQVTVLLTAIAVRQAYHEVWSKQGYFECSTTLAGSTGPCGFLPVAGNVTPVASQFNKVGSRAFIYNVTAGTMSVLNEMQWTQGSFATGDRMRVTFSYQNRTSSHWYCGGTGTSPIVMRWDRDPEDEKSGTCSTGDSQLPGSQPKVIPMEGQQLRSFANTGPASVGGQNLNYVGMAFQQRFTMWFSVFYWVPAPDGYSALQDK